VENAGHDYIRGFENGIQNIGIVAESDISIRNEKIAADQFPFLIEFRRVAIGSAPDGKPSTAARKISLCLPNANAWAER
jgi:hypothetical protein